MLCSDILFLQTFEEFWIGEEKIHIDIKATARVLCLHQGHDNHIQLPEEDFDFQVWTAKFKA